MSSHNFDLPDPAGCAGDRIRRAEQAGDSAGWLHTKLTLNYTYRGLWGSIASIIVMFAASSFTRKTDPAKLEKLTVSWKSQAQRFRGIFDWRLQVAVFLGGHGRALLADLVKVSRSGIARKELVSAKGIEPSTA